VRATSRSRAHLFQKDVNLYFLMTTNKNKILSTIHILIGPFFEKSEKILQSYSAKHALKRSPIRQTEGEISEIPSYDHRPSGWHCIHVQYICEKPNKNRNLSVKANEKKNNEKPNLTTVPSHSTISTRSSSTSTSSATPSVNMMR
jgi:hypothetical protein